MTPLFLRYRNDPAAPWLLPPALPLSAPTAPAGAFPLSALWIATEPEQITGCGCPTSVPYTEDYVAAHITLPGLDHSEAKAVTEYLLNYKIASLHEAELDGFTLGVFINSELTNLVLRSRDGSDTIEFRLAATITAALTP